jgi:hypothetical protein
MAGGAGLAVAGGLGKLALDLRKWREQISRDRRPWDV